jgi:hypothetical protein
MPESERVVAMKRAAPLRKTESTPTLRLFRERRGLFCLDLYRGRPSGARPYRPYCLFRYRHTPGRGESKWPLLKRRPYQCDCEFWGTCSLRRDILSAPSAFGRYGCASVYGLCCTFGTKCLSHLAYIDLPFRSTGNARTRCGDAIHGRTTTSLVRRVRGCDSNSQRPVFIGESRFLVGHGNAEKCRRSRRLFVCTASRSKFYPILALSCAHCLRFSVFCSA